MKKLWISLLFFSTSFAQGVELKNFNIEDLYMRNISDLNLGEFLMSPDGIVALKHSDSLYFFDLDKNKKIKEIKIVSKKATCDNHNLTIKTNLKYTEDIETKGDILYEKKYSNVDITNSALINIEKEKTKIFERNLKEIEEKVNALGTSDELNQIYDNITDKQLKLIDYFRDVLKKTTISMENKYPFLKNLQIINVTCEDGLQDKNLIIKMDNQNTYFDSNKNIDFDITEMLKKKEIKFEKTNKLIKDVNKDMLSKEIKNKKIIYINENQMKNEDLFSFNNTDFKIQWISEFKDEENNIDNIEIIKEYNSLDECVENTNKWIIFLKNKYNYQDYFINKNYLSLNYSIDLSDDFQMGFIKLGCDELENKQIFNMSIYRKKI